ncbi:DNA-binding MarR family transcriptional regulator [Nocardioides aromaticivorans]|uniref:MarR family transcriptional regulator n=1 Tax=Nocardioides aromaticivorans TaxID=200618 RepID=A0A7Y9ZMF5_9ACTN|nr:MarR family transcriptional regulator [Nocardioides aromaticivorans]NYI47541.1 DNA-binding MarR family transcriptional regulator [Nocardioides aromaticivorans]QSR26661.1 MarR family transcriptional regulator [Nocardioides aromaticivorans]
MRNSALATPVLDDLICFDLYAASRQVTAAYRPILGELGLTYPQYLVLVVLGARDEMLIKDVGRELRLDHATLSPLLRRLERDGLLTRRRSADDERAVVVALTDEGRAVHARFGEVHCRIAEALGITAEQADQLRSLLRGLTAQLD